MICDRAEDCDHAKRNVIFVVLLLTYYAKRNTIKHD